MKGYFLPNFPVKAREERFGTIRLAVAKLVPSQCIEISKQLVDAQEKLARESIYTIVDWIEQASARWADPNDSIRKEAEATIPIVSNISVEMLHAALDDLFKNLRRPVLLKFIEGELSDVRCLDRFCPKKTGIGFTRAFGPRLITHILPGNISVISVTSLVCGMLAKSANLLRVSPREALLPVLFAETLRALWPEMAQSIGIVTWDKNKTDMTEAAFQNAEVAIVYGNNETITAVGKMIPPTKRTVFYGHKLSLGIIARESIRKDLAEKAAIDIACYDQKGCLSPHLFYVEDGGETTAETFAQWMAQALYAVSRRFPKGKSLAEQAAKIQQLRGSLPLKGGRVFSSPKGVDWTVLFDHDPAFDVSPLSRTIWIKPVGDLTEVPSYLEAIRESIQAIGFALPEEMQAQLIPKIALMGGCRICPIGQMQTPPITWHHDGRFRLLPLLRFVDWENP
ncbi:MAG: acyl-CoA reductase [Nitrospiria bacterium]